MEHILETALGNLSWKSLLENSVGKKHQIPKEETGQGQIKYKSPKVNFPFRNDMTDTARTHERNETTSELWRGLGSHFLPSTSDTCGVQQMWMLRA